MHSIIQLAQKNPSAILRQYKELGHTIPSKELLKKELSSYVFDALEDYMYANEIFKTKKWFRILEKKKKKDKADRGGDCA